jgi:hypothetical protein
VRPQIQGIQNEREPARQVPGQDPQENPKSAISGD